MTKRDTAITLRQMLDFAKEVRELCGGRSRGDLNRDRLLELGVTKLVEMIGEAASRVPIGERQKYSGIQWPQIVAMRNRLVHGYDVVDLDIVWTVVTTEIPLLIAALESAAADS